MKKSPVLGFEGFYEVSDCGRVFSLARKTLRKDGKSFYTTKYKEMKPTSKSLGYQHVHLKKPNQSTWHLVHRLVLSAFVKMPDGKEHVNHKDGVTSNNCLSNLEWCNHSENMIHSFVVLKRKHPMTGVLGAKHKKSKRVIATNILTKEEIIFDALMDAQRAGFKASEIWDCCNGRQKTHYGMKWRYA